MLQGTLEVGEAVRLVPGGCETGALSVQVGGQEVT